MNLKNAIIKFPSYAVRVSIDSKGRIHCFKYNARSCDFEIFKDQFEASDYILEPLPTVYYEVTVQDE